MSQAAILSNVIATLNKRLDNVATRLGLVSRSQFCNHVIRSSPGLYLMNTRSRWVPVGVEVASQQRG